MIARTKSDMRFYSQCSHWGPFLACAVNVLNNIVFKTKIEQLKTTLSLANIVGNIASEDDTEMASPFRLDTIKL